MGSVAHGPQGDPLTDTVELVEAAKAGDRRAFEQLVGLTYLDVFTLALRLTGDEEDARDVAQEAYLRAYRGLAGFRGDARFSTWMHRITANCASTLLAKRRRHHHQVLDDESSWPDERLEADPQARAEVVALRGRLEVALLELPPRLRAVVVLRDIYDLPHDEIARELGISTSAAKVRLHRARKRLRRSLYGDPAGGREALDGVAVEADPAGQGERRAG